MSIPLNFNFPFPLLLQEGDTIVQAAETHGSELAQRLPVGFASTTRPLIKQASDQDAAADSAYASVKRAATVKDWLAQMVVCPSRWRWELEVSKFHSH